MLGKTPLGRLRKHHRAVQQDVELSHLSLHQLRGVTGRLFDFRCETRSAGLVVSA